MLYCDLRFNAAGVVISAVTFGEIPASCYLGARPRQWIMSRYLRRFKEALRLAHDGCNVLITFTDLCAASLVARFTPTDSDSVCCRLVDVSDGVLSDHNLAFLRQSVAA